jgi:putative SOS response-associated peptidase YedK
MTTEGHLKKRRYLILVENFYEWKHPKLGPKRKTKTISSTEMNIC